MFMPLVRFLLPDGRVAAVPAGGLLGRLATATLRFDDARVSEAHALISLRGELLWILSLRGPVEVDGELVREAPLRRGSRVRLADGVALEVEEVELPEKVLAIALSGRVAPLFGEVLSVIDPQQPTLVARYDEQAILRLWTSGIGWRGQVPGDRAFDVRPGGSLTTSGVPVAFLSLTPQEIAARVTVAASLHVPVTVRTTLDELRLQSVNCPTLLIGGLPARIVRELADYQEPVPWQDVAVAVLGPDDEIGLRARWDRNLKTLRRKLESGGYPADLVRSDGHGKVRLALGVADRLEII